MDFIYIGEIVNTHGIKGEVRLLSDFEYKKQAFVVGRKIYIGKKKEEVTVKSYRIHKGYDMFTFEGIVDINDVLIYKGEKAYIKREDVRIDGYFKEDLIGLTAYNKDKKIGTVTMIMQNKAHDILVLKDEEKKYMIPYVDEFISDINLDKKTIQIEVVEGLLNED